MNIRQAEIPPLKAVSQFLVVDAQAVKDGRVEIVDVHRVFGDIVAVVIRLAEADAGLDAAAGHPDGKAAAVMVASIVLLFNLALAIDGAPELAAPNHER